MTWNFPLRFWVFRCSAYLGFQQKHSATCRACGVERMQNISLIFTYLMLSGIIIIIIIFYYVVFYTHTKSWYVFSHMYPILLWCWKWNPELSSFPAPIFIGRITLTIEPRVIPNFLWSPDWPQLMTLLHLASSAGITGSHHHSWLFCEFTFPMSHYPLTL